MSIIRVMAVQKTIRLEESIFRTFIAICKYEHRPFNHQVNFVFEKFIKEFSATHDDFDENVYAPDSGDDDS